jgi:hypothetical protein
MFFWYDATELNGVGETRYTFDEVCFSCAIKITGHRPKSLQELNKERSK